MFLGDKRNYSIEIPTMIDYFFNAFDYNHNGNLSIKDFELAIEYMISGKEDEQYQLAFNLIDFNGDGYISQSDLFKFVSSISSCLSYVGIASMFKSVEEFSFELFAKISNGKQIINSLDYANALPVRSFILFLF